MKISNKIIIMFLLCIAMASVVCADDSSSDRHVDVKDPINVTYHGIKTEIGDYYTISIDYGGETYYAKDNAFEKLAHVNSDIHDLYNYDMSQYDRPDAINGGTDEEFTTQVNDTDFSFDYNGGKTIGSENNAKEITNVYYDDGTEVD